MLLFRIIRKNDVRSNGTNIVLHLLKNYIVSKDDILRKQLAFRACLTKWCLLHLVYYNTICPVCMGLFEKKCEMFVK